MLQSAQLTSSMSPLNRARPCASGPSQAASRWWSVTITAGPRACPAASCRSMNVACAFPPKPSSKPRVQVRPNLINLFGLCCLELVSILLERKWLKPERVLRRWGSFFIWSPLRTCDEFFPVQKDLMCTKKHLCGPDQRRLLYSAIIHYNSFAELSLVLVSLSCCHSEHLRGLCLNYCTLYNLHMLEGIKATGHTVTTNRNNGNRLPPIPV